MKQFLETDEIQNCIDYFGDFWETKSHVDDAHLTNALWGKISWGKHRCGCMASLKRYGKDPFALLPRVGLIHVKKSTTYNERLSYWCSTVKAVCLIPFTNCCINGQNTEAGTAVFTCNNSCVEIASAPDNPVYCIYLYVEYKC